MVKLSNSTKGNNKKAKRPDKVVTIAIIALIGTIITAIFNSPILLALVQITPTFTPVNPPANSLGDTPTRVISSPAVTSFPVTLSVDKSIDDGLATIPTNEIVEMVFYNPGPKVIYFNLENEQGVRFFTITIPPNTRQTIRMPAGDYIYQIITDRDSNVSLNSYISAPKVLKVEVERELCFYNYSQVLATCSP